jgi:hypothetical protein
MGKKGAINSLYQAINMDPQFYFIFKKNIFLTGAKEVKCL